MYIKLAYRNAKRSAKDYLIYIVTMTICVMLFYAFLSVTSNYYHPAIGTEYEFTLINGGMKLAVCAITLLILFLIRYVNNYILRRKQKEFAIQSVMGMEQKTIAWIFFAETFFMGAIAVIIGIFLGIFCSQFITGMLLSAYGQSYKLSWTLFPDTVFFTVCFFSCSLFIVGLWNVRTIQKIKIIDMLYADQQNDPHIKKSRYMPIITILYTIFLVLVIAVGISNLYFYHDPRFPLPVHIMIWGNILAPTAGFFFNIIWYITHHIQKKQNFQRYILTAALLSLLNICFAASVPVIWKTYYLSNTAGTLNKYFTFLMIEIIFLICCIIYSASNLLTEWKEKNLKQKYQKCNLFFFGQIISKLNTTSKTMTLICLTFVLSVFLFAAVPALSGWAFGYLKVRSLYDIQINTCYTQVYKEADLPQDNYDLVTAFLDKEGIQIDSDCIFNLYLPRKSDFHNRIKLDFPIAAISLSDYNTLRKMLGYQPISLNEGEFTTHWKTVATETERNQFLDSHTTVSTDQETLTLAKNAFYTDAISQTIYNSYTDVLYVFPDNTCKNLLAVMRNRYIQTKTTIPYQKACSLETAFIKEYPEEPKKDTGVQYFIRTSTTQINHFIADNFILQATMIYSAVVLMIICLTILSLQQLLDISHYKYRFGILYKLGVEQQEIEHLILKQLAIWFGLPITIAILVSAVIIIYFFEIISAQIFAYVGIKTLLKQIGIISSILFLLLLCYFTSTWFLFKKAITEIE